MFCAWRWINRNELNILKLHAHCVPYGFTCEVQEDINSITTMNLCTVDDIPYKEVPLQSTSYHLCDSLWIPKTYPDIIYLCIVPVPKGTNVLYLPSQNVTTQSD